MVRRKRRRRNDAQPDVDAGLLAEPDRDGAPDLDDALGDDESEFETPSQTGGSVDSVFQMETMSPPVILMSPWDEDSPPGPDPDDPGGTADDTDPMDDPDDAATAAVPEPVPEDDEGEAEVEDTGEMADADADAPFYDDEDTGEDQGDDEDAGEEQGEEEDAGEEQGDDEADAEDEGDDEDAEQDATSGDFVVPDEDEPEFDEADAAAPPAAPASDESERGDMPVSTQEKLQEAIASINEAIPDLNGVMVASKEGFPIAHDFAPDEGDRLAAMAASALGLGRRITASAGLGEFEEAAAWGSDGCLLVLAAGEESVLALRVPAGANLGLVRIEARNALGVIAGLL
jgi:hypothetical protein